MASAELGISLPASWRRRTDPEHGILVSARSAVLPDSGVRPELVLRCAPVDGDLVSWREAALDDLARRLPAYELEDLDDYDLEGEPVSYARFAHRGPFPPYPGPAEGLGVELADDLVSEQWAWLVPGGRGRPGTGITLTGTLARCDYPDWCQVFESVAATVDLSRLRRRRATG